MSGGLETTLQLLAETPNEAAAGVLISALDDAPEQVRQGALRGLLARRSPAGQHRMIERWHELTTDELAEIAEHPGSVTSAIRDAILGSDQELAQNGCAAAIKLAEYDVMPALVTAIEAEKEDGHRELAAETLVCLAKSFYHELSRPRDLRDRRDPGYARQRLLSTLEESIRRFHEHKQSAIVHAFLLLAHRDNAVLKRILSDPLHVAFRTLVERIATDQSDATYRLLLGFLEDANAPTAAINVIAQRYDMEFLRPMLGKVGYEPSRVVRKNLRRMRGFGWLKDGYGRVISLNEAEQHAAVKAVAASGMKREQQFDLLSIMLREAGTIGRRAAVTALADFQGAEANSLILRALKDEDPLVQAGALSQLRRRGLPGSMSTLIAAVDSPHDCVQRAARQCLEEFNVNRYLAAFDSLSENVRLSTGALVRKVDDTASARLAEEMLAKARSRRIRALEAVQSMGVSDQVEKQIIELLEDEDHIVRANAAAALAGCDSDASRAALRQAMLDSSVAVQQAAQRSLEEMTLGVTAAEIDLTALSLPDVHAWHASMPAGASS